jgi:hypothetical protein
METILTQEMFFVVQRFKPIPSRGSCAASMMGVVM